MSPDSRRPETRAVHGPHPDHTGPLSTPIVHSATFSFESLDAMMAAQEAGAAGAYYQRYGHPTIYAAEERLALLEGSEAALLFPSGMAALSSAFLSLLSTGDHVVCVDPCYGGTQSLLAWGTERLGWSHSLVDARRPDTWAAAFRPNTRLLHIESPTNPVLTVVDIAQAAALARDRGVRLTIDNTVASPIGQHALAMGCDLAIYSATKSLGGHSDLLAGVVTGSRDALKPVWAVRKTFGPVPEPSMAWLIERSLKTMALRVRAANTNALELATRLAGHGAVDAVFYPGLPSHPGHAIAVRQMENGFGPLLSFDVRGGAEAALAVAQAFRVIRHAPSLGGVESLVSLPAYTSHIMLGVEGRKRAGIPEGLVRFSAGIEHVDDLWADLEQALAGVGSARSAGR